MKKRSQARAFCLMVMVPATIMLQGCAPMRPLMDLSEVREPGLLGRGSSPAGRPVRPSRLGPFSHQPVPTAVGEVTTLEDPRFTEKQAKAGMWSPLAAVREAGAGLYSLEPYDPQRIPVLFVHGMAGSPRDFRFLIERLDRGRYQPWLFHYPTGVRLDRAARLLTRSVAALHEELGFERLVVTAHSMGGLVARSSLLGAEAAGGRVPIELLVTFSTPWGGHRGAAKGVRWSPAVVPAWIDLAPESDFLRSLRADLPGVPHHLFFGFRSRGRPFARRTNDRVVTVASQLPTWAQERARRTYGFDLDHVEILNDEGVARIYLRILDQATATSGGLEIRGRSLRQAPRIAEIEPVEEPAKPTLRGE